MSYLNKFNGMILKNILYEAKHFIIRYPNLFILLYSVYAKRIGVDKLLVRSGVDIVIEGFPRSANTFAVVAFKKSQSCNCRVAHHVHAETQILKGVQLGIPVVVLIRHPADAIYSLMIRHPRSSNVYIKRYIEFYSAVMKVKNDVVIANFDTVTNDFDQVVSRINEKFRSSFSAMSQAGVSVAEVLNQIERINDVLDNGKISHLAIPAKNRELDVHKYNSICSGFRFDEALKIYESLLMYSV